LAGLFSNRGNSGRREILSQAAVAILLIAVVVAPNSTESAVANGDTRTVIFSNSHTNESGSFTYMVNGVYDQATLDKLNWFLRDWRLDEPTKMDPHLFDIIWEVYRESGSREPIDVLSAYRSPQTNAMLRRRSRQVAEHSQHMEGRAIDAHFIDVGTARIRDITMRMQAGGVGFYPTGATPWVHIDSGSVRYWPRMSRDALARLFPDGKTVFIPADGQPMPGYDQARAEIEARGGEIQTASNGGIFAWLFGARGGGEDDAEEASGQETLVGARGGGRSGGRATVQIADAGPEAVARAKRDLPVGPSYASPAPAAAPAPAVTPTAAATAAPAAAPTPIPAPKPQVVAALEQPSVESDASPADPVKLRDPIAALYLAPMPPPRPSDLGQQIAIAYFPMPPMRPADLVGATAPDATGSPAPLPPIRPANFVVAAASPSFKLFPPADATDPDRLPKAIIGSNAPTPAAALALAEMPAAKVDDDTLLTRAAELTAPLPPMPIPIEGARPTIKSVVPVSVKHSSRLFGFLPIDLFGSTAVESQRQGDSRGSQ
jgi:uncharacterized protein YcbK (DUF882 family)